MLASPVLGVGQAAMRTFWGGGGCEGAVGGVDGYNFHSYAPCLSWFYMFLLMFKDML